MKRSKEPRKVVIVGAGPGGLANAMLMAKAGCDVTVLERADRVGGRTTTIGGDGFNFDIGATFFLYPQILRDLFRMCGRSLDDEVELMRLDPHYRLVFGNDGGDLEITPDVARMERAIARLAPDDAPNLRAFLDDNRTKLDAFRPVLQSAFHGWRDLFRPSMLKLLTLVRPWSSVDGDLSNFFEDPRIRLAFSFQSKYLGMSPFQCPSLFTILSFLEYEYGVFHPRGGCGSVPRAMARVASDLGAKIRLNEPVEEILFDGRRATGVRTAHGTYACDALTINADFANTMQRLVPNALRRRWTDRKLEKKRYSCSTYMMYLGLEGRCDLDHHTIALAEDYESNMEDISRGHRLSDDPSFYMCNPSVTDDTMAPPGHSALYVLVPVTHQHPNVDWNRERDRFRQVVIRKLEDAGVHNLEHRIRYEKIITPMDWESGLHIYRGATFNLAHSLDQMLHLRPRNRFEDLDGVYLVGGGTHPGSGLPVIFESSRITSRLIADDLELEPAWETATESVPPSTRRVLAGRLAS
jgi:phytoene desaturase